MFTFLFLAMAGSGACPSPWRGLKPKSLPLSNPVIRIIHAYPRFVFVYLCVLSSNGERTKPCRCEEEGGEEGDWLRSHASEGGQLRRVVFRGISF